MNLTATESAVIELLTATVGIHEAGDATYAEPFIQATEQILNDHDDQWGSLLSSLCGMTLALCDHIADESGLPTWAVAQTIMEQAETRRLDDRPSVLEACLVATMLERAGAPKIEVDAAVSFIDIASRRLTWRREALIVSDLNGALAIQLAALMNVSPLALTAILFGYEATA